MTNLISDLKLFLIKGGPCEENETCLYAGTYMRAFYARELTV